MEDCRISRHIAEWNTQGKKRRGRPVSTWKDGIRDSTQRVKNVWIQNSGIKQLCLWVEENCVFKEKCL
jgi:hypothetical protein